MRACVEKNKELKSLFDTNGVGYEILHSEVHRRVKNNLNTIASILGLQINTLNTVSEKNTEEILKNCKQRIETIAINHEALHQSHKMGEVFFDVYARNLTELINNACNRNISVEIKSDQISLPAETMFLIGVILSELFTNSIKYAFKNDKDDDQVKISLLRDENSFHFIYYENQRKDINIDNILNTQTLGIRLVKLTVKQLGGTFVVTQNRGLVFIMDFFIGSILESRI